MDPILLLAATASSLSLRRQIRIRLVHHGLTQRPFGRTLRFRQERGGKDKGQQQHNRKGCKGKVAIQNSWWGRSNQ